MTPLAFFLPLVFAAATSLLVAAVLPLLRPRLAAFGPSRRRSVLLALAFAPALAAIALPAVALLPSALGLVWPSLDHCTIHGFDGHPHLCFRHAGVHDANGGALLFAGVLLGGVVLVGVQQAVRLVSAWSLLRRLRRVAVPRRDLGASVFDAAAPLALTSGARDPGIFLSTGLLSALSLDQVGVVLAHERHHAAARDPFWRTAAALASSLHLPGVRGRLLSDLHLACEQCCDEEAARVAGDRELVAQTILDVTRLLERHRATQPRAASAFGEHHVVSRVESLLSEPVAPPSSKAFVFAMTLAVLVVVAAAGPLHHGVETVLAVFVE